MRTTCCFLWTVLLLTSVASPALAAVGGGPLIYDLGTLGGTYSGGFAVNDAGQVAGQSYLSGDTAVHAFRYDGTPGSGGVMRDLGTLRGTNSIGYAINAAGQVAGSSIRTGNVISHAFRYDGTPGAGGVMRDLLALGGTDSIGYGVNDAGAVAGTSAITDDAGFHAFRYDGTPGAGGVMRDLGTLGGTYSDGIDVNNAGAVTGEGAIAGDTGYHAFRYDGTPGSGGVMRDLGTLGGTSSYGYGINEAGQVAGNSEIITGDTATHAFRYDGTPGAGGVMRDLGTLGGMYGCFGFAINDAGQVVGTSYTTDNAAVHAFLYNGTPGSVGQMIDLDTWLDANNPAEGAKWTLVDARSISNTGWITGTGYYDPDGPGDTDPVTRAYLLDASSTVPEPATIVLFGVALAALFGSLSQRSNSRRIGRRSDHWRAVRRPRLEPLEDRRLLSFSPAVSYPAGAVALVAEVVTADFNNDGNLDLATTNVYSQVNVLLGNGAGGFAAAQQFNPGGFSLAAGDLNKDGKIDLVTANHIDGRVGILFGKGDGTFQPVVTKNTSGYPLAVAVADFNGDGNLDIVVIEDGESTWVQVLLGNGAGGFTAKHELGVYALAGLTVGDLNGDGMLDVVMLGAHLAGQEQAQGGQVLLGRGDGTFRYAPYLYTGPDPLGVAIADFTGDGKPDLLVAAQDVELIRGNGDGSFDVLVDGYTANGAAHAGVATGDFNADGKLDAVVSDLDTNTVSMMLGKADGTLRYAGAFAAGQAPTDITVGDFNRDGRLDVAVTGSTSESATVSVLLNDGNWPAASPALTGDYNGNGEVDAADYIVWRKTLGTGGVTAFSGADGDGNGTIEPNDHVVWRAKFGNVPPPTAGSGAGEASSVQIQELRSSAPAVRNIAADNFGVSVVQIPMEAISAPAEIVAVAAQSASFAALEIRSLWHDSSRRSLGRIDQYQVADSGDDDLPLLLAIDRVGRSPRQDSFVSDDNGNSEHRADDDDSESEIGTVRNARLLHFVRLISATG